MLFVKIRLSDILGILNQDEPFTQGDVTTPVPSFTTSDLLKILKTGKREDLDNLILVLNTFKDMLYQSSLSGSAELKIQNDTFNSVFPASNINQYSFTVIQSDNNPAIIAESPETVLSLISGTGIGFSSDPNTLTLTIGFKNILTSVNAGDGIYSLDTTGDVVLDIVAGSGITVNSNTVSLNVSFINSLIAAYTGNVDFNLHNFSDVTTIANVDYVLYPQILQFGTSDWGNDILSYTGGYSGSQGGVGYLGSHGYRGSRGVSGSTGDFGDPGVTGILGYAGSQGYTGIQGYHGSTGISGTTGIAGFTGNTGQTGNQGATGQSGDTGYQGSTGISGYQGSLGIIGYSGSTGIMGYSGSAASAGSLGYSGSALASLLSVNTLSASNGGALSYDGVTGTFDFSPADMPTETYSNTTLSNYIATLGLANTTYVDQLSNLAKITSMSITCATSDTGISSAQNNITTFRMPFAFYITDVRAALDTAQTSGNVITVDINESGTSILSTKLTIDNGERTSTSASTPVVVSDHVIADDAEITIDIDQVGDGTAKCLSLTFVGYAI